MIEAELPLESVGARLMRAREAMGQSRAQMAAITKIPERHLAEIESNNFAALPARTYAVGFSRSYAKALGLDDKEIVDAVRAELAMHEPAPTRALPAFEPGDPARVPAARFAWFAALAALVVVIAGIAFAWRSYYSPGGTLPSVVPEETAAPSPAATGPVAPAPAPVPTGPVVFTALEPKVWVKFYDGTGKQLMQKEMAQGDTWTVPQNVPDVKIWTANPQALSITVGGRPVPKLAETQQTIKDIPVTAAALLARGQASAAPAPSGAPVAATAPAHNRMVAAQPHHAGQPPASPIPQPAGSAAATISTPAPAAAAAPAPSAT